MEVLWGVAVSIATLLFGYVANMTGDFFIARMLTGLATLILLIATLVFAVEEKYSKNVRWPVTLIIFLVIVIVVPILFTSINKKEIASRVLTAIYVESVEQEPYEIGKELKIKVNIRNKSTRAVNLKAC